MATLKNTTINDTGYLGMPVGTTAQRPSSPAVGYTRVNSSTNYLEMYYNGTWVNLIYIGVVSATGGTITYDGNFKIHTFTNSGTFQVIDAPVGATVEVLAVAGGGGSGGHYGGNYEGGAGGGGGYLNSSVNISVTSYAITVGGGGAAGTQFGVQGTNTVALGLTAIGGGYGGGGTSAGGNGGSGIVIIRYRYQ